ncbi:ParB/RepB/Spo0J family partition protein [Dietzia maris]|uniref:ParB/RepB/Spo0J family partition protein n=1 Tax=Dietzia maris TaxID=37915 RepID=UPI0037CA07EE
MACATGEAVEQHEAVRPSPSSTPEITLIPVERIRPEDGLGRKRDREGHLDLQRSIEQFGVLTPITVRSAPDNSGDYLLIKGQGRTLACRLLGIEAIPAIIMESNQAETEKVQQFLVENVARLKMRPADRALLIKRARQQGEETSEIARRFGLTPSTVRRLLSQLEDASRSEVEALRSGEVSLALHALIARHVEPQDRPAVLEVVNRTGLSTREIEALLVALGWKSLTDLGPDQRIQRLILFNWACETLCHLPGSSLREKLQRLAAEFPVRFEKKGDSYSMAAR